MILRAISFIFLISLLGGCYTLKPIALHNLDASPEGTTVQFFYESQGGKTEAYLVRPKGKGPFPLMVLLHGHSWSGDGAKRILPAAEQFSESLCYASLAISLPGYGMTEIPGDRDNKEIINGVVMDGISKVRELPWVNGQGVLLYGFSRGAVFAATMINKIEGLRAVVLQSGAYDLIRLYQDTSSQWIRRSLNPNGDANPLLFNILPDIPDWTAPTLILHGGNDQLIPANQAVLLHDRLAALGKPHRFAIFPEAGHRLPQDGVRDEVLAFLTKNVGSACAANDP